MKTNKIFLFFLLGFSAQACAAADTKKCGDFTLEFFNVCDYSASVVESSVRPICQSQQVVFGKMKYSVEKLEVGTDLDSDKKREYLSEIVDSIYCVSSKEILLRMGNGGNCDECEWYMRGDAVTGELLDSRKSNFSVKGFDTEPIFDVYKDK